MALDYNAFMPVVRQVALSVSKNFPSYVLSSDTEGAILLWIASKKDWIEDVVRDAPHNWKPKIVPLMRKVAFDHCNKEKADIEGYDISDVYRYSVKKIQNLLPDVFNHVDWQSFGMQGDGQPSSKAQANTTGDRVVELIDIKVALGQLKIDSYNFLVWQYKYHLPIEDLADTYNISVDAARKRSQRALGALQKQLGYKAREERESQPQRRTVRSNATARAISSNAWDG